MKKVLKLLTIMLIPFTFVFGSEFDKLEELRRKKIDAKDIIKDIESDMEFDGLRYGGLRYGQFSKFYLSDSYLYIFDMSDMLANFLVYNRNDGKFVKRLYITSDFETTKILNNDKILSWNYNTVKIFDIDNNVILEKKYENKYIDNFYEYEDNIYMFVLDYDSYDSGKADLLVLKVNKNTSKIEEKRYEKALDIKYPDKFKEHVSSELSYIYTHLQPVMENNSGELKIYLNEGFRPDGGGNWIYSDVKKYLYIKDDDYRLEKANEKDINFYYFYSIIDNGSKYFYNDDIEKGVIVNKNGDQIFQHDPFFLANEELKYNWYIFNYNLKNNFTLGLHKNIEVSKKDNIVKTNMDFKLIEYDKSKDEIIEINRDFKVNENQKILEIFKIGDEYSILFGEYTPVENGYYGRLNNLELITYKYPDKKEKVKNPDTGIIGNTFLIIGLILISIFGLKYKNKYIK